MKANENGIGLETAILFKDCGVESKHWYYMNHAGWHLRPKDKNKTPKEMFGHFWSDNKYCPAFTWQEILWEHAEEFFGVIYERDFSKEILFLLQEKKYEEADLYFRENCILIQQK